MMVIILLMAGTVIAGIGGFWIGFRCGVDDTLAAIETDKMCRDIEVDFGLVRSNFEELGIPQQQADRLQRVLTSGLRRPRKR